jgi:sulfite reductase alpha subunit-like flavoprotein
VRGFTSSVAAANDFSRVDFASGNSLVVIVCSTTGNGDPPANAEDFWRHVRRRTNAKDLLARHRFTVLGLGDTNYDKFW